MSKLQNVDDAVNNVLKNFQPLESETIPLTETLGRVVGEDIISDINLPSFDNSAMDGFAVIAAETINASREVPVTLKVTMDILAGEAPPRRLQSDEAARIMTGAPLPEGANAVIPVEVTSADFSAPDHAPLLATVQLFQPVRAGDNVRYVGENIASGQIVLAPGTVVNPAAIGVLASIGKRDIPVIRKPCAVIVGSGDELVDIDEPIEFGKIRDSNSYVLQALVTQDGGEAIRLPRASDNPAALRSLFEQALSYKPDVIISTAGVSVGAADYVRTVLDEMGSIDFWRINMRPGKPLAFGKLDTIPFLGLPGNPVSAMITYDVIVRPALLKMGGKRDNARYEMALAGEPMRSDGRRTYTRVSLQWENEQLVAYETGTQSSGAHMSMVIADGLMIIPENVHFVEPGTALRVRLLRDIDRSM